jgi:hypothetical protein
MALFLYGCGEVAWKTTLLHKSASCGWTEVVNALMQAGGIDVNARNGDDATALYSAFIAGHYDIVNVLLDMVQTVMKKIRRMGTQIEPQFYTTHANQVG